MRVPEAASANNPPSVADHPDECAGFALASRSPQQPSSIPTLILATCVLCLSVMCPFATAAIADTPSLSLDIPVPAQSPMGQEPPEYSYEQWGRFTDKAFFNGIRCSDPFTWEYHLTLSGPVGAYYRNKPGSQQ